MLPSDFPERNIILLKPSNVPANILYDDNVPAFFGVDSNNMVIVIRAWLPSKEDIDAMQDGRPIYLKVYADHIPPMSLFTRDAEGEINE